MNTILAALVVAGGGGSGLIGGLLALLAVAVCLALVYFLGNYLFGIFGAPPIFLKVWQALFICIAVLAVINFIAGTQGHAFVTW